MSQQINLLVREAGKVRYGAVSATVLVLIVLFGALMIAGLQYRATWRLQGELAERQQILAERGAELEGLRHRIRLAEGAATAAQSARSRAVEALKVYLMNNAPGRTDGPSVILSALAGGDTGRTWLTQVIVGSGGVRLEGRALEPAAVLDYAAALNARFADADAVFRTVEMNGIAPGQGVSFRLY